MKFSVIIPYYKDYKNLIRCLESLQYQDYDNRNFEVIVVNNDIDNDLNIGKEEFKFLNFSIVQEMKPGSYVARNKGISEAKGEIIAFTDSDMLPNSNWLQTAFQHFFKDTEKTIGILTGPVPLFFKNNEFLTDAEVYEKYTGFDFEGYVKEGACGAGNWFSYKSVLNEFRGFREDLKSNGDTELSLRISRKYKVVYIPELANLHPARYTTKELVFRYRRILGGTFARKYKNNNIGFLNHTLNFIFRRYRFSFKKFLTVPIQESWAIFKVCNAINMGAVKEYIHLVRGGQTKR